MPDKNKIILGTNDDTYIAADDAGNIVLQHEEGQRVALTDSAIEPATDETLDLGTATNKFKDLYLSSDSIYIGNTKLSSDPTTGALSTVVADEQGQFTAPAAPVGGGESSAYDWVGEGYTFFPQAFLARTDAGAVAMQNIGTINLWDPIETFKFSQANPSLMPYNDHYNSTRKEQISPTLYSDYFTQPPADNWQMGTIGADANTGTHENNHECRIWNEAEADRNTSAFPQTLFKDSNDKYFYDFLIESLTKNKTESLLLDMVFEVNYTCSDAATAAATPFFDKVTPDSDGVYRRSFFKMWMTDHLIAPKSFKTYNPNDPSSTPLYNDLQDFYWNTFAGHQFEYQDSDKRDAWTDSSGWFMNEFQPTVGWDLYNDTKFVDGFIFPAYGYGRTTGQFGEQAHAHYDPYIVGMDNNYGVTSFTTGVNFLAWGPDFFENGSIAFPAAGQTSNEGRGCERLFKIKIKK